MDRRAVAEVPSSYNDQYYEKNKQTPFKKKELLAYISGGVGDSFLSGIVNVFLMVYATEVFGVSALAVGTIFFIAKFTDAISDPIVGVLVDRTQTRFGKLKPYLLGGGIFWAILTMMLFNGPIGLSADGKFVYLLVVYILWGVAFTCFDVPYWSFSTVITPQVEKRTQLVSVARTSTMAGMIILSFAGGPIVAALNSFAPGKGYSYLAIIASGLAILFMLFCVLSCKERVQTSNKNVSFKQMGRFLLMNRPLQLTMLALMLNMTMVVAQTLASYFAIYNLGNIAYMALLNAPAIAIIFTTPIIVPFLVKRFEKKMVFLTVAGINALNLIAYYFVGYDNITLVFLFNFIMFQCAMIMNTIIPLFVTDAIDYGEWKMNSRFEAVSFSIQSFATKVQAAFASLLVGGILTWIGYSGAMGEQTASTVNGFFMGVTIVPAVLGLLTAVPLLCIKFSGSVREQALAEIANRNK